MSNILTDMAFTVENGYLLKQIITIGNDPQKYVCVEVGDKYLEVQKLEAYEAEQKQPIKMQQQKPYYQRGRW